MKAPAARQGGGGGPGRMRLPQRPDPKEAPLRRRLCVPPDPHGPPRASAPMTRSRPHRTSAAHGANAVRAWRSCRGVARLRLADAIPGNICHQVVFHPVWRFGAKHSQRPTLQNLEFGCRLHADFPTDFVFPASSFHVCRYTNVYRCVMAILVGGCGRVHSQHAPGSDPPPRARRGGPNEAGRPSAVDRAPGGASLPAFPW